MKQRITHPRKALWIYHCELCNHTRTSVDQFRAIEAQQLHERGTIHTINQIAKEFKHIAEAFKQIGIATENSFNIFAKAFTLADSKDNYTLAPPQSWVINVAEQHRPKGKP